MPYPLDRLRHHVSGAVERGEAKPIRAITQEDLNAAQRGLGMLGKSPAELDTLAAQYAESSQFAGQSIHLAAKQMAAAKRRAGATD